MSLPRQQPDPGCCSCWLKSDPGQFAALNIELTRNVMSLKDTMLALLVVLIWGINFSIIKIGLEELPPLLFSALRFALVAVPAVFFIPFPKTSVWNVLGVGLFLGVLKFGCLFFAMKADVSAGLASLLLQAQVFFTIGLSLLLFRERLSRRQLLAVLVATSGFLLFFLNDGQNMTFLGLSLLLLAAFFWSIANLIMKRVEGVQLLHFMVWVCLVPPLPLLLLSYLTETSAPLELLLAASHETWSALIYVSFISTLVAFSIWGSLLKSYAAVTVTPFALLVPVVGIITSSLVLGESLSALEYFGCSLIMLGLVLCVLGDKWLNSVFVGSKKALKID
jgi:O-acetylserine/cysteine efflux transporter